MRIARGNHKRAKKLLGAFASIKADPHQCRRKLPKKK
jgi:hypothetical protein